MARSVNIVLQNYTITNYQGGNTVAISANDEFYVYLCPESGYCVQQTIEQQIVLNSDTAVINFNKPDEVEGNLRIQLKSDNLDEKLLTAYDSDGNIFIEPFVNDESGPLYTSLIYEDIGSPTTISPNFEFNEILGCNLDEEGPFPDMYGNCRRNPVTGEFAAPNPFGY